MRAYHRWEGKKKRKGKKKKKKGKETVVVEMCSKDAAVALHSSLRIGQTEVVETGW